MTAWEELKPVLARLRDQQPCALMHFPMPEADEGRQPPFEIRLAPWAAAIAEDLHRQFGDDVELMVGTLPYPPGRQQHPPAISQIPDLLDPQEIAVALNGPAVARSGRTLRHGLLLRNLTGHVFQIATNGQVTAAVVDPQTGEVVGGFSGAQTLQLVIFRVAPGQTEQIPLLIGTASLRPGSAIRFQRGNGDFRQRLRSARTLVTRPAGAPRSCPSQSPSELAALMASPRLPGT